MKIPKVSVIMPVYNGEKFLRDAVESILNQTFSDIELIVINDGSSDSSVQIITSYTDPRIVFINNDSNMGLPYARNQGVDVSRGEYIAWLDCDDTSMPDRLEKQVRLLDENPQIGVCGAWVKIIGGGSDVIAQYPSDPEYVRASLLFNNCLANSTVMMRAACTRDIGLRFDPSHHLSQDYGLWVRIPRPWQITNLPEVLTIYRLHTDQVTEVYKQKQIDISWQIQKGQLLELGILPTEEERTIHMGLSYLISKIFENPDIMPVISRYINRIHKANQERKLYNNKSLQKVLLEKWRFASEKDTSSKRFWLLSFWMSFKFDDRKLALPLRIIKKLLQIIQNFSKK
jgi:glycosyltransferase involved in cell wall biosynthesis